METFESLEQFIQLDSVQFQELIEKLDMIVDYQDYLSNMGLVIICFSALACGIILGNIFSRYIRG